MEQRMEEEEERVTALSNEKKKLQGTIQDLEEQWVVRKLLELDSLKFIITSLSIKLPGITFMWNCPVPKIFWHNHIRR